MTDQPSLKRDSTMDVTAQEGREFLKSQGMPVTEDDVKTRGQQELLDAITSTNNNNGDAVEEEQDGADKPKLAREGTMAVTAKEGADILEGEELEKTRAQTAAAAAANENEPDSGTTPEKPKVTRDTTIAVTTKEAAELLKGEELEKTRAQTAQATPTSPTTPTRVKRTSTISQTTEASSTILDKDQEYGKTRSQTRKLSESSDEAKKPSMKRTSTMAQTAKEGLDYLEREEKRSKADEGDKEETPEVNSDKKESEAMVTEPEQTAEA